MTMDFKVIIKSLLYTTEKKKQIILNLTDECCMSQRFFKKLQRKIDLQIIESGVEIQMAI